MLVADPLPRRRTDSLSEAPLVDLAIPGPKGRQLLESQADSESNARTYPRRLPVAVAEAHGSSITDVDGRIYLDFLSGAGVLSLGHNHPELTAAVQAQLGRLTHGLDLPTPIREEFKQRQLAMLPDDLRDQMKIHFCGPTGSDAVEAAIKLCKKATGRGGVVAFSGAYHGSTQGAMSLTSETATKAGLHNLLPGVHFSPYAYCLDCPLGLRRDSCSANCADVLTNTLDDTHGGVPKPAAIILELVQGEGGSIPAPVDFVQKVAATARRLEVPLVVDEVQSGCGRTGTWFAFEQYGIRPDVIVASKGLSGMGLPVAIILYRRELDTWSPGSHIGTFRGNNLAFAAGCAYIDVLVRDRVLDNVRSEGEYLLTELQAIGRGNPLVREVRGRGLMLGVELAGARGVSATEVAAAVQHAALSRGLIVEVGGRADRVLRLLPALNVTHEMCVQAAAILADALEVVRHQVCAEA